MSGELHGARTPLARCIHVHVIWRRLDFLPACRSDLPPAFAGWCTRYVSTSNLSSPLLDNWGWGEVVTDGIGVAYNIKTSEINANVTCCQG